MHDGELMTEKFEKVPLRFPAPISGMFVPGRIEEENEDGRVIIKDPLIWEFPETEITGIVDTEETSKVNDPIGWTINSTNKLVQWK